MSTSSQERALEIAQDIMEPYGECTCPEGWHSCPWCKYGENIAEALHAHGLAERRAGASEMRLVTCKMAFDAGTGTLADAIRALPLPGDDHA